MGVRAQASWADAALSLGASTNVAGEVEWLDGSSAVLDACADAKRVLYPVGHDRVIGGARVLLGGELLATVLLWGGGQQGLVVLGSSVPGLVIGPNQAWLACHAHATLLLCVSDVPSLRVERGQRSLGSKPPQRLAPIRPPGDVRAEIVDRLRSLVQLNRWAMPRDARTGLALRLLRESLHLRVRAAIIRAGLTDSEPMLARLLCDPDVAEDATGCFLRCAEEVLGCVQSMASVRPRRGVCRAIP